MQKIEPSLAGEDKMEGVFGRNKYNIAPSGLYKLLDLCCGLKGVSREFEKLGWNCTTVDINPKFNPDIIIDINDLHLEPPGHFDVIWASPVCIDYTKYSLPASWKCNGGYINCQLCA